MRTDATGPARRRSGSWLAAALAVAAACGSSPDDEPIPTTRPVLTTAATPLTTTSAPPVSQTRIYTIQPGDTLNAIANGFGVSVDALMAANGITDPTTIQPGGALIIPPPQDTTTTVAGGG